MKYFFVMFALFLGIAPYAHAGRANALRVRVIDVQCTTLESSPLQYEGIARVVFLSGFITRMRFERGTNADILATCRQLESVEGTTVTAIYNFDLTPPAGMPSRIIHGFVHSGHSHIVNGTVYGTRSMTASSHEVEEDFASDPIH
jgi:hypothetical protein